MCIAGNPEPGLAAWNSMLLSTMSELEVALKCGREPELTDTAALDILKAGDPSRSYAVASGTWWHRHLAAPSPTSYTVTMLPGLPGADHDCSQFTADSLRAAVDLTLAAIKSLETKTNIET